MKYYSYSASLSSTYRKSPRSPQALVAKERVPETITALDVLLSIWIAEAVLETEAPKRRGARKAARRP